jgi:hypothetical protein
MSLKKEFVATDRGPLIGIQSALYVPGEPAKT